jgi:hypothetical protein
MEQEHRWCVGCRRDHELYLAQQRAEAYATALDLPTSGWTFAQLVRAARN